MKKIAAVFVLLNFSLLVTGQQNKVDDKKKGCGCRFQSVNQSGAMQGEYEGALLLQTVNGIKFKQGFAGIGVGVDNYRFRGVPLFADIRHYIFNKQRTPFIYGDAGIHINWLTNSQKEPKGFGTSSNYSNGVYTDVGLGYSLGFKNNMALVFSAGYSYKNIGEKRSIPLWCLVPPCPVNIETYNYGLNRVSLKAGLQF